MVHFADEQLSDVAEAIDDELELHTTFGLILWTGAPLFVPHKYHGNVTLATSAGDEGNKHILNTFK